MDQQLMKKKLAAALRYSYTRLALNYYMYFERLADLAGEEETPLSREFREEFQRILKAYLDGEGDLDGLDALRDRVIREMDAVTAYTDCFQVYEHVLNRLEPKFEETDWTELEDDRTLADEVISFLLESKDPGVVNERIRMVMEQLPIRLTRGRFFSMVRAGLSVYKGAEKSSLDSILYVLKSESMIRLPEGMEEGHKTLQETLDLLRKADYRDLTGEQYRNLSSGLRLAVEELIDLSGDWVLAADLVNDLYVLHLCREESVMDAGEKRELTGILDAVWRRIQEEDWFIPEEETQQFLENLEGRQERYYEKWLRLEMPEEQGTLEAGLYSRAKKVELLLSGSSFMDLDGEPGSGETVDEEILDREAQELFRQLEELWAGMPKAAVRATMARILSSLPVCFTSVTELEDYIRNSLEGCGDAGEKAVAMELIRSFRTDDWDDEMV